MGEIAMPELINPATLEHPAQDPPWTRAEFYELVGQMVTMSAPRLFAIVQEYGEAIDVRIAAWGIAFADSTEIVTTSGDTLKLTKPETALAYFATHPDITAHLIWADAASQLCDDDSVPTMGWCPWHGPFPRCQPHCPFCPVRISSLGNTRDDQHP
jgi:hypothetical protein